VLGALVATILAAVLVGVLETLVAGYVDPLVGAGFSSIAAFILVLAGLCTRPSGLFGAPEIKRI
jgi:branched-chain amino acid transport system permease protein